MKIKRTLKEIELVINLYDKESKQIEKSNRIICVSRERDTRKEIESWISKATKTYEDLGKIIVDYTVENTTLVLMTWDVNTIMTLATRKVISN